MTQVANTASSEVSKPRRLSLRANFSWTFLGNVVFSACQWGTLAVFAKWGSPELVGVYGIAAAISNPVFSGTNLHLRQVQATDSQDEYLFEHYFGLRITTAILALLIILLCLSFGEYDAATTWVIVWVGVMKCFGAVGEILRGLFQRYERMNFSGTSMMIRGPLGLATIAAVFLVTRDIALTMFARVGASVLVLVLYDTPRAYRLLHEHDPLDGAKLRMRPSFEARTLFRLAVRAFPLAVGIFLISLSLAMPRYVLYWKHGKALLGYYDAVAYAVLAGSIVMSAAGQALAPRLATKFVTDLGEYQRLLRKFLMLALVLGVLFIGGVAAFGKFALGLLYTPDYAAYHIEFIILSFAGASSFLIWFGSVGLAATRNFYVQMVAGALTIGATVVCSFALVPTYGVRGAAVAALAGQLITCAAYFLGLRWLVAQRQRELIVSENNAEPMNM